MQLGHVVFMLLVEGFDAFDVFLDLLMQITSLPGGEIGLPRRPTAFSVSGPDATLSDISNKNE